MIARIDTSQNKCDDFGEHRDNNSTANDQKNKVVKHF